MPNTANGTVIVKGRVPNWNQPLYYEEQNKISGAPISDPSPYNFWAADGTLPMTKILSHVTTDNSGDKEYFFTDVSCLQFWTAPTAAANTLGYFSIEHNINFPHFIHDGLDAGPDTNPDLSTVAWGSEHGWGDFTLDSPNLRLAQGHIDPATNMPNLASHPICSLTDIGYYMNTNSVGIVGDIGGNMRGTTLLSMWAGLSLFFLRAGWSNMVGVALHRDLNTMRNASRFMRMLLRCGGRLDEGSDCSKWSYGPTPYSEKLHEEAEPEPAFGNNFFGGESAALTSIANQINEDKPVTLLLSHYNLTTVRTTQFGQDAGNAMAISGETEATEYGLAYPPWGNEWTGGAAADQELQPDSDVTLDGQEDPIAKSFHCRSHADGLWNTAGHVVTVIGYIAPTSNSDSVINEWCLIVRDNLSTTARNVIIPMRSIWPVLMGSIWIDYKDSGIYTCPNAYCDSVCLTSSSSSSSSASNQPAARNCKIAYVTNNNFGTRSFLTNGTTGKISNKHIGEDYKEAYPAPGDGSAPLGYLHSSAFGRIWGDSNFVYRGCQQYGVAAYKTDYAGNLTEIVHSGPSAPNAPPGAWGNLGSVLSVWGNGSFLFAAGGRAGLICYEPDSNGALTYKDNITIPENETSVVKRGEAMDVFALPDVGFGDRLVYTAAGSHGLYVHKVDPSTGGLSFVASAMPPNINSNEPDEGAESGVIEMRGVWSDDNFIYVAGSVVSGGSSQQGWLVEGGVWCYELQVSGSQNTGYVYTLAYKSKYTFPDAAGIDVHGHNIWAQQQQYSRIYVAMHDAGAHAINVDSSGNLTPVGFVMGDGDCWGVHFDLEADLLYTANAREGVHVYKVSSTGQFARKDTLKAKQYYYADVAYGIWVPDGPYSAPCLNSESSSSSSTSDGETTSSSSSSSATTSSSSTSDGETTSSSSSSSATTSSSSTSDGETVSSSSSSSAITSSSSSSSVTTSSSSSSSVTTSSSSSSSATTSSSSSSATTSSSSSSSSSATTSSSSSSSSSSSISFSSEFFQGISSYSSTHWNHEKIGVAFVPCDCESYHLWTSPQNCHEYLENPNCTSFVRNHYGGDPGKLAWNGSPHGSTPHHVYRAAKFHTGYMLASELLKMTKFWGYAQGHTRQSYFYIGKIKWKYNVYPYTEKTFCGYVFARTQWPCYTTSYGQVICDKSTPWLDVSLLEDATGRASHHPSGGGISDPWYTGLTDCELCEGLTVGARYDSTGLHCFPLPSRSSSSSGSSDSSVSSSGSSDSSVSSSSFALLSPCEEPNICVTGYSGWYWAWFYEGTYTISNPDVKLHGKRFWTRPAVQGGAQASYIFWSSGNNRWETSSVLGSYAVDWTFGTEGCPYSGWINKLSWNSTHIQTLLGPCIGPRCWLNKIICVVGYGQNVSVSGTFVLTSAYNSKPYWVSNFSNSTGQSYYIYWSTTNDTWELSTSLGGNAIATTYGVGDPFGTNMGDCPASGSEEPCTVWDVYPLFAEHKITTCWGPCSASPTPSSSSSSASPALCCVPDSTWGTATNYPTNHVVNVTTLCCAPDSTWVTATNYPTNHVVNVTTLCCTPKTTWNTGTNYNLGYVVNVETISSSSSAVGSSGWCCAPHNITLGCMTATEAACIGQGYNWYAALDDCMSSCPWDQSSSSSASPSSAQLPSGTYLQAMVLECDCDKNVTSNNDIASYRRWFTNRSFYENEMVTLPWGNYVFQQNIVTRLLPCVHYAIGYQTANTNPPIRPGYGAAINISELAKMKKVSCPGGMGWYLDTPWWDNNTNQWSPDTPYPPTPPYGYEPAAEIPYYIGKVKKTIHLNGGSTLSKTICAVVIQAAWRIPCQFFDGASFPCSQLGAGWNSRLKLELLQNFKQMGSVSGLTNCEACFASRCSGLPMSSSSSSLSPSPSSSPSSSPSPSALPACNNCGSNCTELLTTDFGLILGGSVGVNVVDASKFINSQQIYFRKTNCNLIMSFGVVIAADIVSVDVSNSVVYIKPYQIQTNIVAGNCVCAGSASPTSSSSSSVSSSSPVFSSCCLTKEKWAMGGQYDPNQTVKNKITVITGGNP